MIGQSLLRLALAVTVCSPVCADDLPFSEIVVFGDSLSDSGNLHQLTNGQLLPPPYAGGRASNGPVWVELLAEAWNVSLNNWAFVGAQTGSGLQEAPPSILKPANLTQGDLRIPSIGTQISRYLRSSRPTDETLFVVWAGANDIFFGEMNNRVSVRNVGRHIRTLARNGAQTFLVPNLPPLDKTPFGLAADPHTQLFLKLLVADFNTRLEDELQAIEADVDITIIRFNVSDLVEAAIADPEMFSLTDAQTPSILFGDTPPLDPSEYLFWDDVHPTAAGHTVLANAAKLIVEQALVTP